MKTLVGFLMSIMIFFSCEKKEVGSVVYKIRFTTNDLAVKNTQSIKSAKAAPDELYNNFGDYITSLTPTKFVAKIWTIGYCDGVMVQNTNGAQIVQYIDQNPDNLPMDDSSRFVDFSNNVVVNFDHPVVFGRLRDGILEDKSIDFIYFFFMPYYLYQEIPLPAEYEGVALNSWLQQDNATVENNILKTRHSALMRPIFPNQPPTLETYFYFGNTDSTFIVNPNHEEVPTSTDNPMISPSTRALLIRSDKYVSTMYHSPDEGETVTMNGIVSFNTTDLIQVYAGADNIPYTSDDVFVYAPNFWERISSRLDIQ
jgi:hypothetical protein